MYGLEAGIYDIYNYIMGRNKQLIFISAESNFSSGTFIATFVLINIIWKTEPKSLKENMSVRFYPNTVQLGCNMVSKSQQRRMNKYDKVTGMLRSLVDTRYV